ncbi:MAG: phosphate-starvation-inducible PsiE family protein [Cyanobacteria bacterium SBLK]|nr:phosphate-starvation-inducible PsiE family protein [Cyanobacteria bacterium SBLK]
MKFYKVLRQVYGVTKNDRFLWFLKIIESLVSKVLSLLMVGVILWAIGDLCILLVTDLFIKSSHSLKDDIFDIFGLFLNILVALEILENITAYLKKHSIQLELVIVTSLIAVSRKIIIFDLETKSSTDLIAISIAVFMLSISYFIVRSRQKDEE